MIHQEDVSTIRDLLSARTECNPTVIGCITELGKVTAGTNKNGGAFQVRTAKLTDNTGTLEIILWNDQVHMFDLNNHYTISNGWFKEYKGKWQLNISKTTHMELATPEDMPALIDQKTLDNPDEHMTVHYDGVTNIIDDTTPQIDDEEEERKAMNHVIRSLNFLKAQGYSPSDDALVATVNTLLIQ